MKNTQLSILIAVLFAAFAAGCGTGISETPETASDIASEPVADRAPEQPAVEGMELGSDQGTILPEETKTFDSGIAEPKIIGEGDVPQDTGAALTADSQEEQGTEETPEQTADTTSDPAHTSDQPVTADPGINKVYPNRKKYVANTDIHMTMPAPQPQETYTMAPYYSATAERYETPSIRSPSVRIDCGRLHLPGCP